jgi:alkylhydroperoxidase family enzyme
LQLQGQDSKDVDAVATLKINEARLSAKEQAMLDYVKVLTLEPWKVRDTHTEKLRKTGWSDEQMFEISFITSLFAFTNRMADAHGLNYPSKGWLPPDMRQAEPANLPDKPTP